MLGLGEEQLARQKRIEARLGMHDRMRAFFLAQIQQSFVFSDEFDPTDPQKQQGRTMSSETLIRLIRRLNPALTIAFHPFRPSIIVVSNGGQTKATFAAGILPEYSVLERRIEYVERPMPLDAEGREILSVREHVPERTRQATARAIDMIFNDPVKRYDEDAALRVLEQVMQDNPYGHTTHDRITRMGREIVRGWRTVLIRLFQQGLITVGDLERSVAHGDNQSWAVKLGRREAICPV